jgi:hypothetical protein
MPRASLINSRCTVSALIAACLLCGCEDRDVSSEQTQQQHAASSADESSRESIARSGAVESQEWAASVARLSAEIDAAVAHRTELQQQRAAIDARLIAHEERGMALLDSLKSEMQERASQNRDDAAFKTEARVQLEASLEQDDALTSALREVDARIAATNVLIDRLSAERKELQARKPAGVAARQD